MATSVRCAEFEFSVRLETVGLSRLYPKLREALLRMLERLLATSIERDAKRVRVRVGVSATGTQIEVVDPRRLNPRESLPSELVSREVARASGVQRADSGGLALWATVDRPSRPGDPPAA